MIDGMVLELRRLKNAETNGHLLKRRMQKQPVDYKTKHS
jgi:hypothetical protein